MCNGILLYVLSKWSYLFSLSPSRLYKFISCNNTHIVEIQPCKVIEFVSSCTTAPDREFSAVVLRDIFVIWWHNTIHMWQCCNSIQFVISLSLIIPRPSHAFLVPSLNVPTQLTPSLSPKRKLILSLWKSTGIQATLCSLSVSDGENMNICLTQADSECCNGDAYLIKWIRSTSVNNYDQHARIWYVVISHEWTCILYVVVFNRASMKILTSVHSLHKK